MRIQCVEHPAHTGIQLVQARIEVQLNVSEVSQRARGSRLNARCAIPTQFSRVWGTNKGDMAVVEGYLRNERAAAQAIEEAIE